MIGIYFLAENYNKGISSNPLKERQGFIIKTPKERYLDLLENNKQIISRVPQHQIASYIGISAEHLSRIRKELFTS